MPKPVRMLTDLAAKDDVVRQHHHDDAGSKR
jgi:hypothetical protein